jgi:Beta-eliminating lyase
MHPPDDEAGGASVGMRQSLASLGMALAASGGMPSSPTSSSLSSFQAPDGTAVDPPRPQPTPVLPLQPPHVSRTPAETFRILSDACLEHGITAFDVYGDFEGSSGSSSFLREFERTVADEVGFDDAVFMPSGVMAQSIALLIHHHRSSTSQEGEDPRGVEDGTPNTNGGCFACHESSHLLLHEQHAYRELLGMEALVLPSPPTTRETSSIVDDLKAARGPPNVQLGALPLDSATVRRELDAHFQQPYGTSHEPQRRRLSTLVLEAPHRELGGKVTSLQDIWDMKDYCRTRSIRFHCDGARIFEASAAYAPSATLRQVSEPFDSMYVSFYKGLGGMSGAMLLGSPAFCNEARIWLRRFGGNLYTLLPYAVSAWIGFRQNWLLLADPASNPSDAALPVPPPLSFVDKKDRMVEIVAALSSDPEISRVVTFDPEVPHVNMVHGYLRWDPATCQQALDAVEARRGIRVLVRVRPVDSASLKRGAYALGYRSYFEWTIGEGNGRIPIDKIVEGWLELAKELLLHPDRIAQSRADG